VFKQYIKHKNITDVMMVMVTIHSGLWIFLKLSWNLPVDKSGVWTATRPVHERSILPVLLSRPYKKSRSQGQDLNSLVLRSRPVFWSYFLSPEQDYSTWHRSLCAKTFCSRSWEQ